MASADEVQVEQGEGAIRLSSLLADLQAAHPAVSLTTKLDALGVVPEPALVERTVRELVELAVSAAGGATTVDVETRDLEVEGSDEGLPPGQWVEVVVRDPSTGIQPSESQARSRIAARLIADAQAERRARVIISKSRRGTAVRLIVPSVR